jgi:hypothetical protein
VGPDQGAVNDLRVVAGIRVGVQGTGQHRHHMAWMIGSTAD